MTRARAWALARLLVGAAILALLVREIGAAPFTDALHRIHPLALMAALLLGLATTVCCAWRWTLVARALGVPVPLRTAVAAYYRSLFLNSTLPGGVLGDVDRGVSQGRRVGRVGRSLQAVVLDRAAGQVVQVAVTAVVLLVPASPVRAWAPLVALGAAALVAVALVLGRRWGLLAREVWPGLLLASVAVVVGHTATFLVAARSAGVDVSTSRLLPLALLVLLAMAVPASVAGWGPREGAAAWVFGAAGLGAAQGVTVSVVYGVLALVSTLPGAGVLLLAWRSRPTAAAPRGEAADAPERPGRPSGHPATVGGPRP